MLQSYPFGHMTLRDITLHDITLHDITLEKLRQDARMLKNLLHD